MAELKTKIELYAKANSVDNVDFLKDVRLQDDSDGNGAYIKEWNLSISQPTAEQIASYEAQANTEDANNIIIAKRKSLYGSWENQLEEIYDNGIDAWKTRIAQVKADNPKE